MWSRPRISFSRRTDCASRSATATNPSPSENVISLSTPEPTPTIVPTLAPSINALERLAQSDAAMNRLMSLVEVEVLGDGAGSVLTTTLEYLAPNKLHFKLSTGEESVAI